MSIGDACHPEPEVGSSWALYLVHDFFPSTGKPRKHLLLTCGIADSFLGDLVLLLFIKALHAKKAFQRDVGVSQNG